MIQGRTSSVTAIISMLILIACFLIEISAQTTRKTTRGEIATSSKPSRGRSTDELFDASQLNAPESEMRAVIEYYTVDRASLTRSYPVATSSARRERFMDAEPA